MHRHMQSKTGTEALPESLRSEWGREVGVEHQFEAREHARVSHARVSQKRRSLRSALEREDKRQIREIGAR